MKYGYFFTRSGVYYKLNYTFLVIILIIAINYLLLQIFNFYITFALFPRAVGVVTKYILPWIFSFRFNRLVKAIESK
ncbi:hypothetical protein COE15_04160 [Bacillus cereus]|uniref:hypothetical protein n=1 Tax=Bacillus sp. AFS023182 TaxID=2033492 RepID=UPI000BF2E629|nr:hypothetical protein [Bacillus sp. AFS023182]PFE06062.1 hypothetical protein CN288_02690 [Bacillus sp. AFS023182]PGY04679.1 hypothetical protein COE15_04160 [Bacillus cereus]